MPKNCHFGKYLLLRPRPIELARITDGTSNTIMFGENSAGTNDPFRPPTGSFLGPGRTPSITDGTSNTVLFGERQAPSITDGTSNTVLFGERTPSITDGTSNTVVFGEQHPTSGITDGTSNTIMLTERFPGLSYCGASEALRGSIVFEIEDRQRLAEGFMALFGDGSVRFLSPGSTASLLPAVYQIRDAARAMHPELVPSVHGVIQLLSGAPVCSPKDRAAIAYILAFLVL